MHTHRNLIIFADDPNELALYLNKFGVQLTLEGSSSVHWCAERGHDTIHICATHTHSPDEPGKRGLWQYVIHKLIPGTTR